MDKNKEILEVFKSQLDYHLEDLQRAKKEKEKWQNQVLIEEQLVEQAKENYFYLESVLK